MLVRPPMTNFKMTVRADCVVSACSPLPLATKALAPWLSRVGGSWPLDRSPPSPQVASVQNKGNFPFHQPCFCFGFCVVSGRTPLLVTVPVWCPGWAEKERRFESRGRVSALLGIVHRVATFAVLGGNRVPQERLDKRREDRRGHDNTEQGILLFGEKENVDQGKRNQSDQRESWRCRFLYAFAKKSFKKDEAGHQWCQMLLGHQGGWGLRSGHWIWQLGNHWWLLRGLLAETEL